MIHIVLVEPRIPQNTGNIGRLCVATNSTLHLIEPLGFRIDAKEIKRSGMDYWANLNYHVWENLEHFWESHPFSSSHFLLSTKAQKNIFEANFMIEDSIFLYFGREDAGLDEDMIFSNINQSYKLPMVEGVRSINLATSVGAALYESIRQRQYFRI